MKSRWILILVVVLLCAQPFVAQQDAPSPADETEAARQEEATEGEADKGSIKNGLYVEVGVGTSSMETLDTTLRSASTQISLNSLTFEDMEYSRAAIGWRLPGTKGSFRLQWEGFNEDGYDFNAVGRVRRLGSNLPLGATLNGGLDWWDINVVDGVLTAVEMPPSWTFADDANGDSGVDQDEVTYGTTTFSNTINIVSDLQNRVQLVDLLYGREFGPRRIEGTWWGGLRYFGYEGTLMQGAWLHGGRDQYSDGEALPLLFPKQDSSGWGPVGSLGFQANFFEKRLQLFASGKFAFAISNIETDTGTFYSLVNGFDNDSQLTVAARLEAERSRTSWHTHIDVGARVNLKMGLTLEIAYYDGGFLDAVITPTEIRIPQTAANIPNGTSAFYATQDLRYDGWRSSLAFQF